MRYLTCCAAVIIAMCSVIRCAAGTAGGGDYDCRKGYVSEDESAIKKTLIVDGEVQIYAWGAGRDLVRVRALLKGASFAPDPFMLTVPAQKTAAVKTASGFLISGYELRPAASGYSLYKNGSLLCRSEFRKTASGISEKRFFNSQSAEYLSGMGHASSPVIRSGESFQIYHYPKWGSMTHMFIPFVFSNAGDAFYNNAAPNDSVRFGPDASGEMEYSTRTTALDCYFYHADTPKETVSKFYEITSSKSLLPKWAFGFIQSKYGYQSQREAEKIVDEFAARKIPLSAIVLDLYWFKTMGDYEWDRDKWPDPAALDRKLESRGIKTIAITEPFILNASKNFKYFKDGGALASTSSGEPAFATIWLGTGGILDPVSPAAERIIGKKYDEMIASGIDGFWTDLGEPEADASGSLFGGVGMKDFHNYYNREWSRLIYRHLARTNPQLRVFNLTRSGWAGSGAYGVSHWSGDVKSSFDSLAFQIGLGINDSYAGFSYFGTDVGGFAGTPSGELFTRWYQFGAFTPVFRAHGSDSDREPWRYGDEGEQYDARIKYITLRCKLLPYIYSSAWQTAKNGIPMMRSLALEFPADATLYAANREFLSREYLFGDALLVAPVTAKGKSELDVYLPGEGWTDFHTGKSAAPGKSTVPVTIADIPVFVRAGSIIPWDEDMNGAADTVLLYPGAAQSLFAWYDDDGTTNRYLNGEYEEIVVTLGASSVTFDKVKKAKSLVLKIVRNGATTEKKVSVNPGRTVIAL